MLKPRAMTFHGVPNKFFLAGLCAAFRRAVVASWFVLLPAGAFASTPPVPSENAAESCGKDLEQLARALERFSDPVTGGIGAFRSGELLDGFFKQTRIALRSLVGRFDRSVHDEVSAKCNGVNVVAGGKIALEASHSDQKKEARAIFEVLVLILDRHNEWVSQEKGERGKLAATLAELETEEGVRQLVWKFNRLDPVAEEKNWRAWRSRDAHILPHLEKFAEPVAGGLTAFRGGELLTGISGNTITTLKTLAPHLDASVRAELGILFENNLSHTSGNSAISSGESQKKAADRLHLLRALAHLIEPHNAWVAQAAPERGKFAIDLKELETAEGTRNVVTKLKGLDPAVEAQKKGAEQAFEARLDAHAERFVNLEGGGIAAFRDGPLPNIRGPRIRETLGALGNHMDAAAQKEMAAFFERKVWLSTGSEAVSPKSYQQREAARQVLAALVFVIDHHNAWVALNQSERGKFIIALAEVETEAGMRGVYYKLRGLDPVAEEKKWQVLRALEVKVVPYVAPFSNPRTGGVAAFKGAELLKGFSTATPTALGTLIQHLDEGNKTELIAWLELNIRPNAGALALNGQTVAGSEVLAALAHILDHHNAWVAKHPAERGKFAIDLKEFESEAGARGAIGKLKILSPGREESGGPGFGAFSHFDAYLKPFANHAGGGIVAFKGGKLLKSFSSNTPVALQALTLHLDRATRERLKSWFEANVRPNCGAVALATAQEAASREALEALALIIDNHNAWVARNLPERGKYAVSLAELESEAGLRDAIERLKSIPPAAQDQGDAVGAAENDDRSPMMAFKGGELLKGFSTDTSAALQTLTSHLDGEIRTGLNTWISENVPATCGARAIGPGPNQETATRQAMTALTRIIDQHNIWIAGEPAERAKFYISLTELETQSGMRKVVWKLKRLDPKVEEKKFQWQKELAVKIAPHLEKFSNLEDGGITAFKGGALLRGFASNTPLALQRLTAHFDAATRESVKAWLEEKVRPHCGNTALSAGSSQKNMAREALTALALILMHHDAWIAEKPEERAEYFVDLKAFEENDSAGRAIENLKAAAATARPE